MDFIWFALDCNIWTNPKISKLAAILGTDVDIAVCKIARIWSWAMLSESEDGDITYIPDDELAGIARWKKKSSAFVLALRECGFIDEIEGRKILHGWSEINGKFPTKKRKDRERKSSGNSTEIPRKIEVNSTEIPNPPFIPPPFPPQTPPISPPYNPPKTITITETTTAVGNMGDKSPKTKTQKRFVPPTLDEVSIYCKERSNGIDAQHFIDYYTANGWIQGKGKPIVDWKATVRTWEKREDEGKNIYSQPKNKPVTGLYVENKNDPMREKSLAWAKEQIRKKELAEKGGNDG